jgi:hypothetical protein
MAADVPAPFPFVWLTFFPVTDLRPDPELSPDPAPGPDPNPDPEPGPDPDPLFRSSTGGGCGNWWGGTLSAATRGPHRQNCGFQGRSGKFWLFSCGQLVLFPLPCFFGYLLNSIKPITAG